MRKAFLFLIFFFCVGCTPYSQEGFDKQKILVTIPPYAFLVRALVEDRAVVEIFVPSGSNPHTYEPTPKQIQRFTQAKVWFRTGDPIEQKMVQFLRPYPIQIMNLSKDWATLDSSEHKHHGHLHEEKDLHTWMDPLIVIEQVKEMSLVLSNCFPEIAPFIKDRSQKLIDRLKQTDQTIRSALASFQGRYLVVSHPALGYFCHRYGMHQLSVEVEGKDPLPQDITTLIKKIQSHLLPVVFTEPQYNNKGATLIAHRLNIPLEEINPYAEDYFQMLDHLTHVIVKYYGDSNS